MQKKLFLFGTGNISKKYTELFNQMSVEIEGYIDNAQAKWGTYFYNKKIYGPDMLLQAANPSIFIACAAREEITRQLSRMSLEKQIISLGQIIGMYSKVILDKAGIKNEQIDAGREKTIIVDNLYGMWGGAEDWSHIITASLAERKWKVFVVEHTKQPYIGGLEKNIMNIDIDNQNVHPTYTELIRLLMKNRPFVLFNVRNLELLWAAATIKAVYPNEVRIISSVLNDMVYKQFYDWDEYVDLYLCISSRIKENFINQYGIDKKRVCCLTPFIENNRNVNRIFDISSNRPLEIGYPCRLVCEQKRSDLIPHFIMKLEESGQDYVLNIAGDGPCEPIIEEYVEKNGLSEKVKFYGKLSRAELFNFLGNQDVYINFSEYEGTSLTMLEAMASGCVPVVTDVSGVSDFIENGINGLVADVGNLGQIVEYTAFLNRNRRKLKEYGRRCMHVVQEKCRLTDYMDNLENIIHSV